MTEVTDEQRAAWQRLYRESTNGQHADIRLIASLLPDALMNPQPELPTEPGAVISDALEGIWVRQADEMWRHGASGVVWHQDDLIAEGRRAPFTRLVPERPQVTRQEIASAIDEVVNKWADTGGALASPLTERIVDLVQAAHS